MTRDTGWFKSTYSSGGSNGCVEVRFTDWHKSTHSSAGSNACVEVQHAGTTVGVRDSKNPTGPAFRFTAAAWSAFTRGLATP
ncbi:DUF397 domain-containing protein [Actinosynnema pretiosum]|uniref:DUF397 domain-containing protein n=1 Tax=Actinosynnema pretiosum TaxID=42197 RepID=A0A290ZFQ3_9PSEU|nr:DUF397 domain-containing protein [Actinosynnema pretiosum]ATE57814.1 DUF397 domain-containing protein [Actinosynnema pretiosum]